jgi:hypothetical protein
LCSDTSSFLLSFKGVKNPFKIMIKIKAIWHMDVHDNRENPVLHLTKNWRQATILFLVFFSHKSTYRIKHNLFHISLVIIQRHTYWPTTSTWTNMGRKMITRLIWKMSYFNILFLYLKINSSENINPHFSLVLSSLFKSFRYHPYSHLTKILAWTFS